jgi:hypothetical protein
LWLGGIGAVFRKNLGLCKGARGGWADGFLEGGGIFWNSIFG